ncbi:hypothetical protein V1477_006779 [Vespula maculifrons]|uniref:Uncharacterized protein n=1 Tax=Vespula maculifrons TaxID=7453 RepID=A0ABD2CGN0_VESMC
MNGSHKYFLLVSDVDGKDYTRNWRIKGGRKRRREKEGEMDRLISFNYEPSRPLLSNLGPINGIMTLSIMLKLFGERNSCLLIKSLI